MREADFVEMFGRQLVAAEQRFEDTKAELFNGRLAPHEFAERRALARNLEAALGEMHETRRQMSSLRRIPPSSMFDDT